MAETPTLAQSVVAHTLMLNWRPFILSSTERSAGWLANDLCFTPDAWRYLRRAEDLTGKNEATVFVEEDWRHGRDAANWTAIDAALKICNCCLIQVPRRDDLSVEQWLGKMIDALDAVRVHPRSIR